MNTGLLLLLVGLPPTPSSLRVRVWRRLRALGAAPLKRSAYLLPDNADRYEDFQWLAQEIQREGGEATLVRVRQIENMADADLLRLFHEPRNADYRQLAGRYRKLLSSDDIEWGGSGVGSFVETTASPSPFHGMDHSVELTLPPLCVIVLAPEG